MQAQPSVALELRFVEPLIGGALIRKLGMAVAIRQHVTRCTWRYRRFDVKELSGEAGFLVREPRIADRPSNSVDGGKAAGARQLHCRRIEGDLNSKVASALSDGVAEVPEGHLRIGIRVARHNILAPPAHQFVHGQILEVAAIGEVRILGSVGSRCQQLVQQVQQGAQRTTLRFTSLQREVLVLVSGVRQPPA